MKEEKYGIGTKHLTNEGYWVEVVEKLVGFKRKVRFENGYETINALQNIRAGGIKNPYHLSVFGAGCFGVGKYIAKIDGKNTSEYVVWVSMLKRCYDGKYQERQPTYIGVAICKEWLNFQNFAKWYKDTYPKIEGVKFDLDKDLMQEHTEDKIYSPQTCIFLPKSVNNFLANKYINNTSGHTGVSWNKHTKKWQAEIMVFGEGKKKNLGRFTNPKLASQAYQKARAEQSEKVKDYLRSLNYLPEDTIQLIK